MIDLRTASPEASGSVPLLNLRHEQFTSLLAGAHLSRSGKTYAEIYAEVYGPGNGNTKTLERKAHLVRSRPDVDARYRHILRELRETYVHDKITYEEVIDRIRLGLDACDADGGPNWSARYKYAELALKLLGKHPDSEFAETRGKIVLYLPDNGRIDL